jgi:hypothetical protein
MDTRRQRRLLTWLRRFAFVLALAVIALALGQGARARGFRYRWRPALPSAEQADQQPMPRWYADRG